MDINKYALFVDVADTKNFTKSGERMGYTQPGVSHILKVMEAELGFSLFQRTKQGVVLTHNAEIILPLVRNLLAVNEQLEQTINSINGLKTGHLTIASFASIARNWLPAVIHAFQQEYPGIEIELLEGGTDDIVDWVKNNQADFGLLSRRNAHSLKWISLYEDPLMAIVPKDYELPEKDFFPIEQLNDHPFIISAAGVDYDIHHYLKEAGISPNIRFSSKDDLAIVSMVANHLGISILPRLIIEGLENEITALPLEPFASRELGIGIQASSSLAPAAKYFIDTIERILPELLARSS
ncbi:MAG: LysR family transcriptional regulator [Lachnospiraceae bacterium]|nr:LysR family transcriptional regulator [Lachnospiraceae bacterium]